MPQVPVYRSPYSDSIAALLARQGDIAAEGAQRSGAIWGNTVGQLGQIAGDAVAEHQAKKAEGKQAAALDAFVASDVWVRDPKAGLAGAIKILGPVKGVQFFEGLQGSLKVQQAQTPADARAAMPMLARGFAAAPEASKPKLWAGLEQLFKASKLIPDGQSLGEYNPAEHDPIIASFAAEGAPKAEGGFDLSPGQTRFGPDGKPIASLPPASVEPRVQSLDQMYADAFKAGDTETMAKILKADSAKAAATRAPKEPAAPPAERVFNPEGVVLSSYGVREREEVRSEAAARGIPTFQNVTAQTKGVTLAGIVADAKELEALIALPEVKAAIGPAAGRWSQIKSKVIDLDPNVQRAIQLMTSLSDTELRKRSGAQINEKEMQRLLRFTTDPNRPIGHNLTAVAGLLKSADRDFRALAGLSPGGEYREPDAAPPSVKSGSGTSKSPYVFE